MVTILASRVVTGQDGDVSFSFVSDNLALDLAGTRKWRRRTEPEELLGGPSDLGAWLEQSGVIDAAPTITEGDLHAAVRLREAAYRAFGARAVDAVIDAADIETLNDFAAPAPAGISWHGGALHRSGDVTAALSDVARSALCLLGEAAAVVKQCQGADCTRLFVDRSRGRRRCWCGMEECGNKAKAASYRARRRNAATRTGSGSQSRRLR